MLLSFFKAGCDSSSPSAGFKLKRSCPATVTRPGDQSNSVSCQTRDNAGAATGLMAQPVKPITMAMAAVACEKYRPHSPFMKPPIRNGAGNPPDTGPLPWYSFKTRFTSPRRWTTTLPIRHGLLPGSQFQQHLQHVLHAPGALRLIATRQHCGCVLHPRLRRGGVVAPGQQLQLQ